MDRTYWRQPGGAWHALDTTKRSSYPRSVCGRWAQRTKPEESDRVPSDGHLCGNCGRVIAARTDIEPNVEDGGPGPGTYGTAVWPV